MNADRPTGLRDTVITLAGILILLGIARYASAIVVPLLLSLFISIVAASPINWLKDRGLPSWLSIGIVLLSTIIVLILLSTMLGRTMVQFNEALPVYQARLSELTESIFVLLSERGIDLETAGVLDAIDPGAIMTFANSLMVGLADALGNAVMIMFTTMFLLLDSLDFPRKVQSAQGDNSKKILDQIDLFVKSTNQYMSIKALVSLGTGVLIWLSLEFVGIDFALLWGVIAFVLNFIPNIGSFLAAVPAVLLALVQLGPVSALIVIAIYMAANTIMGNVVETKLMGKKLGLSLLAVFLSLVFWGWLFGSVGMLLSVPLTMAVKFAAMNNPQTRWFGILLSPAPEDESSQPENGKADPGHSSSKHEELNSELAQLRLQLDELRKSRDAEANSTTPDNKK
jgi:predicted PurR-regulated permease PerM